MSYKHFLFGDRHLGFSIPNLVVHYFYKCHWIAGFENIWLAIGIASLSCLQAEIYVFPVRRPLSLGFSPPSKVVWFFLKFRSTAGPQNMCPVVGIVRPTCLRSESCVFPVWWPPSRIITSGFVVQRSSYFQWVAWPENCRFSRAKFVNICSTS